MKKVSLLLLSILPFVLSAQQPFKVMPQDNIRLSWGLKNLSVVDGRLYGYGCGVLLGADMSGDMVCLLRPDTLARHIGAECSYVVRNPRDGRLYYSYMDGSSGHYGLYCHAGGGLFKNRRLDARDWQMAIYHPTFSPDGNMLVFSSQNKVGLGGYDLWCSFWNGRKWSHPLNMGSAINGPGNEVNPVFYGNYLIYSSNRQQHGGTYDFYAVRIRPGSTIEDVLFGSYRVQRLPEPINSGGNDIELAVDPERHCGYWITDRDAKPELYSYAGRLDGVSLQGKVVDGRGAAVPNAEVRLLSNGRTVGTTATDSAGNYRLFVQPNDGYWLQVSGRNFFRYTALVSAVRHSEDLLVADVRHDVTLSDLPIGRRMVFDRLYRHAVDVELSDEGRRLLSPIADFLRDNPQVRLRLTLQCDTAVGQSLCDCVNEQRMSDLEQYFESALPSVSQISISNGGVAGKEAASGTGNGIIFAVLENDVTD